jgi:hypothetical protein
MMKTVLHVGCGHSRIDRLPHGFRDGTWRETRLDIDPDCKPDVIGSTTDMAAIDDASVDAVFSSHNIEHLYAHEVPLALGEFRRVLNRDGFVVITCPDLKQICAFVAQRSLTEIIYVSSSGPVTPLDVLYGYGPAIAKGKHYMAHRCGFTPHSLADALAAAGFSMTILGLRTLSIWALATKMPRSQDEILRLGSLYIPPSSG